MAFSGRELAFQAEDEPIQIVPKQGLPAIELAGWKSPALRALRRSEVPLWLAVLLKRQDRCLIVWPAWLQPVNLRKYVETEKQNPNAFSDLPWFWQLVSQILLKEAGDDLEGRIDDVMQLLQDLRELRLTKIRAGVLLANESHLQMTGLGAMELTEVEPVLGQTMRTLHKIHEATQEPAA